MLTLWIALGSGVAFIIAYFTYGRWLGRKVFELSAKAVCPSYRLRDDADYVPTPKSIVFGHHFTSIAGTGPIVGPAIAVMWGWVPALLWVVFGSIFIGAVHDFGALVVSLRNNGQTVGDISGRVLNRRVRLLFLLVLFLALTIVIAIFGLVIAAVFRQYPAAIFPCVIQVPIAVAIGLWLHRRGVGLLAPSILALGLMYLSVVFGNDGPLGAINGAMAAWPTIVWVAVLLLYSYVASVLPVWTLLQPRDYINSLQLLTALGLVVMGLVAAALLGGAEPIDGVAPGGELTMVAPAVQWHPSDAPFIMPFLFITIACGAISGFHCLVSSGTSSKQLRSEPEARFVGFGAMLTEGFLAVIVILACTAGIGLGASLFQSPDGSYTLRDEAGGRYRLTVGPGAEGGAAYEVRDEATEAVVVAGASASGEPLRDERFGLWVAGDGGSFVLTGAAAWHSRYASWRAAGGLAQKVGAFVEGSANFLRALGLPRGVSVALLGVLVASFAGTTLDTACRLQRYVVQELASVFSAASPLAAATPLFRAQADPAMAEASGSRPGLLSVLRNKHGATIFAVTVGFVIAVMPAPGQAWGWTTAGTGGLILWPMFGATNQLLGGLAFLVITFYLWRRRKPVWFLAFPLVFMLVMPAWAMLLQIPEWWNPAEGSRNWLLILMAAATLVLELWMIVEAVLLMPAVRGVLEPGLEPAVEGVSAG